MNTIYRLTKGEKERLIIKAFKSRDLMHKFTQSLSVGNLWEYCQKPHAKHDSFANMKAGTYVFAGGEWRNVKSIDPNALAHL